MTVELPVERNEEQLRQPGLRERHRQVDPDVPEGAVAPSEIDFGYVILPEEWEDCRS